MDDPVTPEPTAVDLEVLSAWESVIGRADVDPLHADADRVWAVCGEDGREYVLKKILPLDPDAPRTQLVAEYRVLTHLHAAGVPVAVPLVTDEGHIHGDDGNDLYTLSPRIRASDDTPETRPDAAAVYARIGGAIGLLHKALERCPFAIRSHEIIPAERLSSAYWPILRAADTSLAGKVDRLLPHLCETLADLPQHLIHGDCHDGNVLLHDGHVVGFVDLDHLPRGPRIYDLARYLANRVLWAVGDFAERGPRFRSLVATLLDGYQRANALTGRERRAIGAAILMVEIDNAEWCLGTGDSTSSYVTGSVKAAHWTADNVASFAIPR